MKLGAVVGLVLVAVLLGAGAGYLIGNSNERSGTPPPTVTTNVVSTTTVTGRACTSSFSNDSALNLFLLSGSVYCAIINGTAYYADYVSPDVSYLGSGYGHFPNGSISFRTVTFTIQVRNQSSTQPTDVKANMTFNDGTTYSIDVVYNKPVPVEVQHLNPTAGVLLTYGGCPPNSPSSTFCPPFRIYLLVW